jgi:integrase/recombinase XerD
MGASTVNGTGSALRFLFDITLDRPDIVRHLPAAREPRKAPVILSPEEVARMLDAARGLKYKAALSVAYGAGLRVSEVVALKVSDIDSARMMIRIEEGKRRKDRYAMLSPRLLHLLRDWWLACRSRGWLFPGRDLLQPINYASADPGLPHGCAGSRDREAGISAYVAAQLCHPSPGAER